MFLIDRIKQNKELSQNDSNIFAWSCINDICNDLYYFELMKKGSKLTVSCYDLESPIMSSEDVAEGYINATLEKQLFEKLSKKDWRVSVGNNPKAQLIAYLDKSDNSASVADIVVDGEENFELFVRKLMLLFQGLCSEVGCESIKAELPRNKIFIGKQFIVDDNIFNIAKYNQRFNKSLYLKWLDVYGFDKKLFDKCYTKTVESIKSRDLTNGGFCLVNRQIDLDSLDDTREKYND